MTRGHHGVKGVILALLMAGCVGEKAVVPILRSADATLGAVSASPVNAIMAVGDTLAVTVTGQTVAGTPITSFDSVEYVLKSITDTLRVGVSPTGVVTARAPSGPNSPVLLNVLAFKDGVIQGERTIIQVTATAVPGVTLSIQPAVSDSTRLASGAGKTIIPVIRNVATGQSVANPTLRYTFSATDAPKMWCYVPDLTAIGDFTATELVQVKDCQGGLQLNQIIAGARTGTAWVHATVTAYGTSLQDSVQFTLTNPYAGQVGVSAPSTLALIRSRQGITYLSPGGTIKFFNNVISGYGTSVVFTFDNSAAATAATPPSTVGGASGNITSLAGGGQSSNRVFLTPGTYHWTATGTSSVFAAINGQTVSGTIIVQ